MREQEQTQRVGELVVWLAERGALPMLVAAADEHEEHGWCVRQVQTGAGNTCTIAMGADLLQALERGRDALLEDQGDDVHVAMATVIAAGATVLRFIDQSEIEAEYECAERFAAAGETEFAKRKWADAVNAESRGYAGECLVRGPDDASFRMTYEPVTLDQVTDDEGARRAARFLLGRGAVLVWHRTLEEAQ